MLSDVELRCNAYANSIGVDLGSANQESRDARASFLAKLAQLSAGGVMTDAEEFARIETFLNQRHMTLRMVSLPF